MKTEQTTIEDNKLIAEFFGEYSIIENNKPLYTFELDEFKFNASWEWLMPVVEKIENLNINCRVRIESSSCKITNYQYYNIEVANNKIDATYKAVIEFINWYNKQGK